MRRSGSTGQRLIAIFLLGVVLLNYPILSLFARPGAGAPVYAFVFGAWILLIALMALVIERARD